MRKLLCNLIALFSLAPCICGFETIDEALSALSSDKFEDREKASRYLLDHGDAEAAIKLEAMASGTGESALRAKRIVDFVAFGIRPNTSPAVMAVVREYRAADSDGEKRLDAINRLISTAKAGEIDLLRVCEFEAARCSPEQKVALAEIVARILFQGTEPPDDDEVIKFEQFAKELGGEVLAKIVKKHLQKDLAQKWLRIIEPHHRAPLYNAWAEIIRLEDPDADEKGFAPLLKELSGEPALVKKYLVNSSKEPMLAIEILAGDLDLGPFERAELLDRLAEKQSKTHEGRITLAAELARVMFLWGDENDALEVLHRVISADDDRSIRDFVSTVFLMGQLDQWISRYQDNLVAEKSVLNRRVLAQLLRADQRYEDAFKILDRREDGGTTLYELLAIESGNWAEAYRAVVDNSDSLGFNVEKDAWRRAQFHLCAAFLAQHAGLDSEVSLHLAELRGKWVDGVKSEKRLIQGLLIIRRPEMAIETAVNFGFPYDAFEILTLLHKYDEAVDFALKEAQHGDYQGVVKKAAEYFTVKSPEKAAKLREAIVPEVIDPITNYDNSVYRRDPRPAEEILHALIEGDREGVILNEEARLAEEAAKPENEKLRNRLVEWWVKHDGKKQPEFRLMKDVFEAAGEWEFLADSYFDQWRRSRADGALLFKSGYFLEKAGDLDQGLHRQRAANLVPLGHPWTRSGLRYNQEKYGAEKMAENQRAVIRYVGNGTDGDYTNLQREQFHRLRRAGDPRRAALLWSSAHYHMLRANTGIVYGNNFYALNNGMHAQEGFGLQALKEGKVDEAEKRLVESWRLSVEPTCLGKALIEHHRSIGNEELARAIFERFSNQLKTATEQVPGDETLIERLAEWRKMTGF